MHLKISDNTIVKTNKSSYINILKDYLSLIKCRYKRMYIIQDCCRTHLKEEINEIYEGYYIIISTIQAITNYTEVFLL